MTVMITILVGVFAGLLMRVLMPRSGVGGWIGDIALGLVGAMLGAYMVGTYDMGHALDGLNWILAGGAFIIAISMLMLVHWLSRSIPEAPDADQDDLVHV